MPRFYESFQQLCVAILKLQVGCKKMRTMTSRDFQIVILGIGSDCLFGLGGSFPGEFDTNHRDSISNEASKLHVIK